MLITSTILSIYSTSFLFLLEKKKKIGYDSLYLPSFYISPSIIWNQLNYFVTFLFRDALSNQQFLTTRTTTIRLENTIKITSHNRKLIFKLQPRRRLINHTCMMDFRLEALNAKLSVDPSFFPPLRRQAIVPRETVQYVSFRGVAQALEVASSLSSNQNTAGNPKRLL